MARTRSEIKLAITTEFMANPVIAEKYDFVPDALFVDEFSIVSFENILFDILSFVLFVQEQLFDTHKAEVIDIIEQKMPHREAWYRDKAKAFQYGFDLIEDSDKYDTIGFTDEQIEFSKIIKYSAVTQNAGTLLIKIASETAGVLAPITEPEKFAFDAYMLEIADCGVRYIVVNNPADILLLNLQIFIDPLVLNQDGMSILNANYPVEDAVKEYMKQLPFNGELVLAHLVDKLQLVEGVRIPNIVNAESQIYDTGSSAYLAAQPITVKTVPESGYFLPQHPSDASKIAIIDYVV